MKISFLVRNAYARTGGVTTSVFALASALVGEHDVDVVSMVRGRDEISRPSDRRVTVHALVDRRPDASTFDGNHPLYARPAKIFPAADRARAMDASRLTEVRLQEYLADRRPDVVIATSIGEMCLLSRLAPAETIKLGQMHAAFDNCSESRLAVLREAAPDLDGLISVIEGDAALWAKAVADTELSVRCIPNITEPHPRALSDLSSKIVIAAGSLNANKGHRVLVDAFRRVVDLRPDWKLRIYGAGPLEQKLRDQISALGLQNNVSLMGFSRNLRDEFAKASIMAMPSFHEAAPLVVREAMWAGVPVVTTATSGPMELVRHGVGGLVTPVGDPEAMAGAILALIEREDERRAMGEAAHRLSVGADGGTEERVVGAYDRLFRELSDGRFTPLDVVWHAARDGGLSFLLPCGNDPANARELDLRLTPVGAAETETAARLPDVVVPFVPTSDEGTTRCATVAPGPRSLPEGEWWAYVEDRHSGERWDLRISGYDGRALLAGADERPAGQPVVHRIVHAPGVSSRALVRSWVRDAHLEVERVEYEPGRALITCRPIGRDTVVESVRLHSRTGGHLDASARVTPAPGGRVVVTLEEGGIPDAGGKRSVWDLRAVAVSGSGVHTVPLGKVLRDYADVKHVDRQPDFEIGGGAAGPRKARLTFTDHGDLALLADRVQTP
ncbi:glycosyltransferase [Streptomyces sp. NPDC050504]|uniref:glycosyltransferase n=1 Tax=Streptomyces sp. NPDC050504 TaxID=3365618 RepID=UPI00379E219B